MRPAVIVLMCVIAVIAAWGIYKIVDAYRVAPVEPAPNGLAAQPIDSSPDHVIPPSKAVSMYIPAIDLVAEFEDQPCRVKDGAIDPGTMKEACTFTSESKPYTLPGTNSEDLTVIAGHTGGGVPAVFNDLYDGGADKHLIKEGDLLYVRTENSGSTWIVYRATDLHAPEKTGLPDSEEIWGTGPMPGRLLTISCVQPANPLAASVRNAVVGWQYEGVVDPSGVEVGAGAGGDKAASEVNQAPTQPAGDGDTPPAAPADPAEVVEAPYPEQAPAQ